jgi:uncharacterized protein YeaO (DUF488 family)
MPYHIDDQGGEAPCLLPFLDDEGRMPDPPRQPADRVRIKRAYEAPAEDDGYRVLVDRLWPRGLKKEAVHIDAWPRDLAPSTELRRWFGHDPTRWEEFQRRYRQELNEPGPREVLSELLERARHGPVTLVYGARDEQHNDAVVLRDVLLALLDRSN